MEFGNGFKIAEYRIFVIPELFGHRLVLNLLDILIQHKLHISGK